MRAREIRRLAVAGVLMALGISGIADATSSPDIERENLHDFVDGLIKSHLRAYDIPGATVTIVKDGEVLLAEGYGFADLENQVLVDAERTAFRIGSTTKIFTYIAVLQLLERGLLDLDADVNSYLQKIQIDETFPEPVTLRHLITHTAGFAESGMGTVFVPSADYLRTIEQSLMADLPDRVRPPGEITAYSNYGTTLAAYIVEVVTGKPFEQYAEDHIFLPLGMTGTSLRQPFPADLTSEVAVGYNYRAGIYEPSEFEMMVVAPAGSGTATAGDMAKLMIALLQGGRLGEARILREETVSRGFLRLFANDPRLAGMAYGFYELQQNGVRMIAHEGGTPRFHTEMVLIPDHEIGYFVSYNTIGGVDGRRAFRQEFLARYFPAERVHRAEGTEESTLRAEQVSGYYKNARLVWNTEWHVLELPLAARVSSRPDGSLMYREARWVELEPYVYVKEDGADKLAFRLDDRGRVVAASQDTTPYYGMLAVPALDAPPFNYTVLGLAYALFLSGLVYWPAAALVRRHMTPVRRTVMAPWTYRWRAAALAAAAIAFPAVLVAVFDPLRPATPFLKVWFLVPYLILLLALASAWAAVVAWRRGYWGAGSRVHYALVALAGLAFVWWLIHWRLLGYGLWV